MTLIYLYTHVYTYDNPFLLYWIKKYNKKDLKIAKAREFTTNNICSKLYFTPGRSNFTRTMSVRPWQIACLGNYEFIYFRCLAYQAVKIGNYVLLVLTLGMSKGHFHVYLLIHPLRNKHELTLYLVFTMAPTLVGPWSCGHPVGGWLTHWLII